jgi:hypothetical protein
MGIPTCAIEHARGVGSTDDHGSTNGADNSGVVASTLRGESQCKTREERRLCIKHLVLSLVAPNSLSCWTFAPGMASRILPWVKVKVLASKGCGILNRTARKSASLG